MNDNRLATELRHIRQAASDACSFVQGFDRLRFTDDKRTQQAVIMSLLIIGEAARKVIDQHPTFADRHPELPWNEMRGIRNRIAHSYHTVNLDLVWDTTQTALPDLLKKISSLAERET